MAAAYTALLIDDDAHHNNPGSSQRFFDGVALAVDTPDRNVQVSIDCEGINLCRAGTVEIVSICFDDSLQDETGKTVFLVDLGSKSKHHLLEERVQALKKLFESEHVLKVIHDCRMDCDALFHIHGIHLNNVHDTSCFHLISTGREDANLNDMLAHNGLSTNVARDASVYKANPRFWATRPLTPKMISLASSDVDKLLLVADKQLKNMSDREIALAKEKSTKFSQDVVDMDLEQAVPLHKAVGLFIGPRGSNLRALQKRTGTKIYKDFNRDSMHGKYWLIFYPNATALAQVKRAMGN